MIRCAACGTEASPGARFCPGCGQGLYAVCSACDQEVGSWMTFCPHCGQAMKSASPADPLPSSEDNVRLATVLFGDVQGFTAMSERLPPEEVTDIMNRCFEVLSHPIVRYGGTIDKYVGDAIMARFGAPQAHEDDPVRAIHAALEMQTALTRFADEMQATRGFQLAMRIGINTGQVLAGQVGSAALKQFTLMGNTVNLASRLEHEAEPGKVLVGETTYRLARHAFEFEAVPPLDIRGQSEPINAFVPLKARTGIASSRAERSDRRMKLVGRESEMALLVDSLQAARNGQGRLVALVGDPGVGKSRLAEEFCALHGDAGLLRVYAAAPSFGESMPYSMLTRFIRSLLFGQTEEFEITPEELRDRVMTLLPERSVNDATAVLGDVLGVSVKGMTDVSQMEARSRQAMLTNILKLLLAAQSTHQPVLLSLEDMHWVDSASLSIFEQVLTNLQNMRVLVIMTHRTGFSNEWSNMAFYRQINVGELPTHRAEDLLHEFFGSSEVPQAVAEQVMEKAGGNPFFLEQLLNNLVESGSIVERDGHWELAREVSKLSVPDTIQEILLARIDQLPRAARSTLEVASVIGRVFAYRLLQAVAEGERTLDDQLQLLQRQEFVHEKSVLPELEYMFKHSLTHDVAYQGLVEARRRALHERVAKAIETLGLNTLNEQVPLLAVHYEKTANHEKALDYAIAAGDRARQLYANQDAIAHYTQALETLEQEASDDPRRLTVLEALGDIHELLSEFEQATRFYETAQAAADAPSDRARLLRKQGEVSELRGRYGEAGTIYRAAEEALREANDPAEHVNLLLALARMDRSRGALDSASTTCQRALAMARQVDEKTKASLFFELGEIEQERGHLRAARRYLELAAQEWEQMASLEKQALVAGALANVSLASGDLAGALGHFDAALAIFQRVLDREGLASTLFGIGRTRLAMGDLDMAIDCYNQVLTIAREIDYQLLAGNAMLQLGTIHLDQGNRDEAQDLIHEAYTTFKHLRNWRSAAHALVARARLLRVQGESGQAQIVLRRAAGLAQEMHDPWLQAQIAITEAELAEEGGDLALAAGRGHDGLTMARELSDPRLIARAERILGRVRARQGQLDEALSLLADSTEILRHSGAQVEAARAALDYVVVAQSGNGETRATATEMLTFALETFDRAQSKRDLRIAQSIAHRMATAASRSRR